MGYLETECLAKNVLLHYSQMRLLFDMTILTHWQEGTRGNSLSLLLRLIEH